MLPTLKMHGVWDQAVNRQILQKPCLSKSKTDILSFSNSSPEQNQRRRRFRRSTQLCSCKSYSDFPAHSKTYYARASRFAIYDAQYATLRCFENEGAKGWSQLTADQDLR